VLSGEQGAAAAVLSHPADTLLSKVRPGSPPVVIARTHLDAQINRGAGGKGSATSKLIVLAKEAGPRGLFVCVQSLRARERKPSRT
jgi:solute carrier family 25 phosphate transporter 3